MPKVRRKAIPPALLEHLIQRVSEREIPPNQIGLLAEWLDKNPEVPQGRWFKRFSKMTVCGEGELVKTFLQPEQAPIGQCME